MGADRTLVQAALAESTTRYGGDVLDQSNLYKSTIDISAGYSKVISDILEVYGGERKEKRKKLDSQLDYFKNIAEIQLGKLYDDEDPLHDKIIDADWFDTFPLKAKGEEV